MNQVSRGLTRIHADLTKEGKKQYWLTLLVNLLSDPRLSAFIRGQYFLFPAS